VIIFRDNDGTLCFGPQKYIMFGTKPKEYSSPLEKGDHPEIDTSEELNEDGIKMYQSMIGCLQLAISPGHFDIHTVTIMS
jgi:hypothetical protein